MTKRFVTPATPFNRLLFDQIVAHDLEGIVCKRKDSRFKVTQQPSRCWIKIKNRAYSQLEGRMSYSSVFEFTSPVRRFTRSWEMSSRAAQAVEPVGLFAFATTCELNLPRDCIRVSPPNLAVSSGAFLD